MTAIIWQWLARIRQLAMLVFWLRARRTEFPALFDRQRMIPLHGRKLLVALESLVLIGETRLLFLVSWRALQMSTRHVEMRGGSGHLRSEGTVAFETVQSSLVAEAKGPRSTETSSFCGKHARRNDLRCNGSVASTSIG